MSSAASAVVLPTAQALPVDLPEHDAERADDRPNVGQHVPVRQHVHGLEVGEGRRADLAPPGLDAPHVTFAFT